MPEERSAGAVIYHRDRQRQQRTFLLLKYGGGHWDFVKGNIEEGEEERDTVLREAEEEAGLQPQDLVFHPHFRETIEYFYRKEGQTIHKEVVYFLAQSSTREVRLSFEHTDYVWLPLPEALDRLTYDTARRVLRAAAAALDE